MKELKFSVLIPTYNSAKIISDTLNSILQQSYQNFEIIIQDDASKDDTEKVIRSFKDKRITFYKNKKNLGYSLNLNDLSRKGNGEIIYLMGQDDILDKNAFLNTNKAFQRSENIGAVARPYYWFDENIDKPVRATKQLNPVKDEIVRIGDRFDKIILTIDVAGQLSGLAYRRKYIDREFHKDIFPCHVYPFISILKKHPIVFLKDYNLAVRISSSQCRFVSSIYNPSPLQTWINFCNDLFSDKKYEKLKKYCIDRYFAKNYLGLIQIRNYGKFPWLIREILLLIKYRWKNLFNIYFWVFSLGCIIVPPKILIPLVDFYKNHVNSRRLKNISINHCMK